MNGTLLVDFLWDTTDRLRRGHGTESLLGLVGFREENRADTEFLGTQLGVPWC